MKKIPYLYLGIILIVLIGMINPFLNEWKTGWNKDKNKICLPYITQGIVFVYEGYKNCSDEQIKEKTNFMGYYCKEYSCHPVWKGEKEIKRIYEEYKLKEVSQDD